MTGIIQILNIGINADNFLLYSDVDNYLSAFETNVSRQSLLDGFPSDQIPGGTTIIRCVSTTQECPVEIDIDVSNLCYSISADLLYVYFLDYIFKPNKTYFYGNFDEYTDSVTSFTRNSFISINDDLTIDQSINIGTGFTGVYYLGESMVEQPDGKLIFTGSFTEYNGTAASRIIRLNSDFTVDTSFVYGSGFGGAVFNYTQGCKVDSNGSIVVTGLFDSYNGTPSSRIARLLSNGTIDPSFAIGSGFTGGSNTGTDVLINPDNSIFCLGFWDTFNGTPVSPGITKLTSTGSIDPSFDAGTGIFPYICFPNNQTCFANYFFRYADETSFYVTGHLTIYNDVSVGYIVKINEDGSIDTSADFGTGFNNITQTGWIIWNDKIFVQGDFTEYNGTPSYYNIILNLDGSIFYTFDVIDFSPYLAYYALVIGNKIYAPINGCYTEILDITNCNDVTSGQIECAPTTTTTTTIFSCQFSTNQQLKDAALLWVTDNAQALIDYGPINNWSMCPELTDMSEIFYERFPPSAFANFNDDISNWDTSNITNMENMFGNASSFNQDISTWDVSSVTNMESMFFNASSFNQDINAWDVSNVTDMKSMFLAASSFNQSLNNWDVSSVTSMVSMFNTATVFNQDISSWDTSSVTRMSAMFAETDDFNQDITSWDISNVVDMNQMFSGAESFNQPIGVWDVSSVTDMRDMFVRTLVFNQPLNSWDTSSVIIMTNMFAYAEAFNQPLDNWDVSNVNDMSSMFSNNDIFDQDLNTWDVSNVVNMNSMFQFNTVFNGNISNWSTGSCTNFGKMFKDAPSFNQDVGAWDVSAVMFSVFLSDMFNNASSFNQDLTGWCVTNITSEPGGFSTGSLLTPANKPIWGTCPP